MGEQATLPKVGIVTVTYNSANVLTDFFQSLWDQTYVHFVLYVVDNASSDETLDIVRTQTDRRVSVCPSPVNVGIAEGNNIGIRLALEAGCDSVLLLNNDVVFEPGLISLLVKAQHARQSDMIAPKMMYYSPADTIWWAGGYFQRLLGYRAIHMGLNQVDSGQCNQPLRVAYSPTCCVLIERHVFESIGLMDARYFVYWDDTDFMLRAHKAGLCLYYEPAGVLYHKVGSLSKGIESPFILHLLARNRVYFWLKHLGKPLAWLYTASLSVVYLLKYLLFLKRGPTLRVQLKGMLDGLKLA